LAEEGFGQFNWHWGKYVGKTAKAKIQNSARGKEAGRTECEERVPPGRKLQNSNAKLQKIFNQQALGVVSKA
jgi:hypothetical protein